MGGRRLSAEKERSGSCREGRWECGRGRKAGRVQWVGGRPVGKAGAVATGEEGLGTGRARTLLVVLSPPLSATAAPPSRSS